MMQAADRRWISIGALARGSGVPVATLRNWERRYGFPSPERKPSGHRLYSVREIPRLQRMGELIRQGHRVGDLIRASDEELARLVDPPQATDARFSDLAEDLDVALAASLDLDGTRLTRTLLMAWARLGPIGFLDRFLAPLLQRVGLAWESGDLQIRHEHFLTAAAGDLLRTVRLPLESRAHGPLILLATLPGEDHGLGLEMAAVAVASAGWRCRYLGTNVPVSEISASVGPGVRAVGLSVSRATEGDETDRRVLQLRALLPPDVALVLGGAGAHAAAGIELFETLSGLATWAEANSAP